MGEALIDVATLSYTYPVRETPSLTGVDLRVHAGEFVLVSGPTGCGKSTLLRAMNGIIPHDSGGTLDGEVRVLGRATREAELVWLASRVGLVFQSPEDQLFSGRVEDEVAFGLENLRLDGDVMTRRVRWALDEVGLADAVDTPVAELSGGQKQRLAVAAVIAMQPKVLLLDEPLSQLDPAGAGQVLDVIARLRRDLDIAVVLVEHRMHDVVHLVDRVVLMDAGRVVLDRARARAFDDLEPYERLGLRLPETITLMQRLGRDERPLTVDATVALLDAASVEREAPSAPSAVERGEQLAVLNAVNVGYTRRGPAVLREVDFEVSSGDVVAVMGPNGSGKSTLLYTLLGGLRPSSGSGTVLGRDVLRRRRLSPEVGMLFQSPELMLLADTVLEEVLAAPLNLGLSADDARARADEVMHALGIDGLADEPPLALSRGQRLRVALASVLGMRPRLLLLDEPTTGQDRDQIASMMDHLTSATEGRGLVFCTHDVSTAAAYATRVVVMSSGRVLASGPPAAVFRDDAVMRSAGLHAPAALEIARRLGLPETVSIDAVARSLAKGGEG